MKMIKNALTRTEESLVDILSRLPKRQYNDDYEYRAKEKAEITFTFGARVLAYVSGTIRDLQAVGGVVGESEWAQLNEKERFFYGRKLIYSPQVKINNGIWLDEPELEQLKNIKSYKRVETVK